MTLKRRMRNHRRTNKEELQNSLEPYYQLGPAQRKGVFNYVQTSQIQIHPTQAQYGHLLSIDTIYSVQWFC